MAKGQKRSNREIRKPKQDKPRVEAEKTFAGQLSAGEAAKAGRGKAKAKA